MVEIYFRLLGKIILIKLIDFIMKLQHLLMTLCLEASPIIVWSTKPFIENAKHIISELEFYCRFLCWCLWKSFVQDMFHDIYNDFNPSCNCLTLQHCLVWKVWFGCEKNNCQQAFLFLLLGWNPVCISC